MNSVGERVTLLTNIQIICLFLVAGLSPKQYFKQQPQYTEVNPGGTVILDCLVAEKTKNSECIWQHDGLPVLIRSGKYEWSGSRETGDCSLRILRANIIYDDGEWECQVTRSSYEAGDGLNSETAKLVVRQPPSDQRIFKEDEYISNRTVSLTENRPETLRCESRGGNPAPRIVWFLENKELESDQRNETEAGNSKRWTVISTLQYAYQRGDNGKVLRCSVHHEALTRKVREETLLLDVQYPPSVRLERTPNSVEVEDEVDAVALTCIADGNPKPDVVWRKLGESSIFRIEDNLRFEPVRAKDSGTYICLARNILGASDEISANVEVRYPPRKVRTNPSEFVDLEVGDKQVFTCSAEANPEPQYEWVQKFDERGEDSSPVKLGLGREIVVENVTYNHAGLWSCSAWNLIKGEHRKVQSQVLRVAVTGRPLVLTGYQKEPRGLFQARLQDSASLEVIFCSDPPPTRVRWEWGSTQLEQGKSRGRISALELSPAADRKDCYSSRLLFSPVSSEDARTYYLVAENERGELRNGVQLSVMDPISMVTVIAISVTCLLLISFLLVCIVCTRRYRKCCFRNKGHFQPQEIRIERRAESEPSDSDRSVDLEIIPASSQVYPSTPGLGQELTYKGHAGLGRPVPAPFCSTRPTLDPPSYLYSTPRTEELIQPKKVRGTPTMYADLQFPSSSNFGSMKRRNGGSRETEYVRIKFNPYKAERAEL